MRDFQISNCSQSTPQIITMEVGGGINPYAQSVLSLSRRFVWQEVGNGVIASGGLGFSESDAISGEFAGVVAVPGESFLIATAGALAFFPDQSGALFAWDTGQPSDQTPAHESPPVSVDGIQRVTRGSIDVVYLEDQRYLVARVVGSQVVVEEWTGTANTSDFTLRGEWWRSDGLSRPDDVELATFDGGFALFYQQRVAGAGNSWTVQPFEIAGDTLTEYRCAYSYEYAELEFIDNDLIAFREGENLFVVAAVRFRLNGEFINIEGPAWSGLFQ